MKLYAGKVLSRPSSTGAPTVKGDDYSDFKLMVNVGTPAGSIYVRSGYPN